MRYCIDPFFVQMGGILIKYQIKRGGSFTTQLNQIRGEALALGLRNFYNDFTNPDGSARYSIFFVDAFH